MADERTTGQVYWIIRIEAASLSIVIRLDSLNGRRSPNGEHVRKKDGLNVGHVP